MMFDYVDLSAVAFLSNTIYMKHNLGTDWSTKKVDLISLDCSKINFVKTKLTFKHVADVLSLTMEIKTIEYKFCRHYVCR